MKKRPSPADKLRSFHDIYTVAPQMFELFERMRRVARSDASVLIRGETGSGKELVARALHQLSARASGPFRSLNCATVTPELLASRLFGHIRGAFTGAVRDRRGLFQLAHTGTIFLDEIAELPLELQARLLRVLQERAFTPVGAAEEVSVDVRVFSATHQGLRQAVADRRFREDLMYRIRVVPLFLPPLCERTGDVEALTWHFVHEFNRAGYRHVERVEPVAMNALLGYSWPGNVRELRNAVEHGFAIGDGPNFSVDELPPELRGAPAPREGFGSRPRAEVAAAPAGETIEEMERARILEALRVTRGRKGEAAKRLGINRSTLWRKLREYRISS
jgi:two-component system response regulator AtoC